MNHLLATPRTPVPVEGRGNFLLRGKMAMPAVRIHPTIRSFPARNRSDQLLGRIGVRAASVTDDVSCDRVANELAGGVEPELLLEMFTVRMDGLRTQV